MDPKAYEQFRTLEKSHWWFRGRRTVYLGLLRHHLFGSRPRRVLDLGAGMGGFLEGLDEIGEQVFLTDTSFEGLKHCAARGFRRAALAEGYRLPFQDDTLDVVCLFDVIEHLDDDLAALREVKRILRPGGLVLVTVPAYPWLYANNDRVSHHRRRYTRAMLAALFDGAGLKGERNTHANVLLFPLIAPAVLAIKLAEKIFARNERSDHTNLSWPIPGFVHGLLHAAFAAELSFAKRVDLPLGHSIAAIARK